MALLRNITETLWNYVSPRKTQQRRDKPFRASQPEFKVPSLPSRSIRPSNRSMSPTSKFGAWNARNGSVQPSNPEVPPSPISLERPYTDLEGDTLIDELVGKLDESVYDANEETVVVDEAHYDDIEYDPERELARREAQAAELRAAGWTEDAVFLFQKLGMRGFEPLLPSHWSFEFVMMPPMIFTENIDNAYIKNLHTSDYHAEKALQELMQASARARDAIKNKAARRTPEEHIRRAVLAYSKWAIKDGQVTHDWNLPIFEVVSGSKKASAAELQDRMIRKLDKLAERWHEVLQIHQSVEGSDEEEETEEGPEAVDEEEEKEENGVIKQEKSSQLPTSQRAVSDQEPSESSLSSKEYLRELPTLYGIIASHTILGIVSYDIMSAEPALRTVAIFDFGREDYDVWNALAVAIFVVYCRNRMMDFAEDLQQLSSTETSDPDA